MKRIDLIAGARPNFMKIAPTIDALKAAESRGGSLRFHLIHTGQYYDRTMSGSFFEELGIPSLTLRDNTERPVSIRIGTNELLGTDPNKLPPALARLMGVSGKTCVDSSEMGRQGGRADRRVSGGSAGE